MFLFDSGNGWPVAVFGDEGVLPGVLVELEPGCVGEVLPERALPLVIGSALRVARLTGPFMSAWPGPMAGPEPKGRSKK